MASLQITCQKHCVILRLRPSIQVPKPRARAGVSIVCVEYTLRSALLFWCFWNSWELITTRKQRVELKKRTVQPVAFQS